MMGQFNATEQDYTLQVRYCNVSARQFKTNGCFTHISVQGQQGAPLHAVQVYTRGQVCDLTGTERSVDVRFLCSRDPIHIRAIEEIVSCKYVIVVGTPAMCSEALGTAHGGREKVRNQHNFWLHCVV